MDSMVGALLAALEESGKKEETVVVYLGDHGADMFRGKRTCYEGGVRIPLLLRWPGHVQPQVRDELVSTIDLMPTLLAVAEAASVSGLPGKEWQPLFDRDTVVWRSHLFTEYHAHAATNFFPQRAVRGDRFKLIETLFPGEIHPDYEPTMMKMEGEVRKSAPGMSVDSHAVIASAAPQVREAYARMRQPPRYELYDLRIDPFEFHNLAEDSESEGTLTDLRLRLDEWRRRTNDPLMDETFLRRLRDEVRSVKTKKAAKARAWRYPDYFFGRRSTDEAGE
jgi:N-sulfoglucosamine sulfohydrolase